MKWSSRAPVMQARYRSLPLGMLAISLGGVAFMARLSYIPAAQWVLGLFVAEIVVWAALLFVNIRYGR